MRNDTFSLPEVMTVETVPQVYDQILVLVKRGTNSRSITLDFTNVRQLDSAGVVALNEIRGKAERLGIDVVFENLSPEHQNIIGIFSYSEAPGEPKKTRPSFFEAIGEYAYRYVCVVRDFFLLLSNISYFAFVACFRPKLRRKGEVIRQSNFIGVSALPIVALVSFLIGLVMALQAAVQMRPYGADIFVAQLITYAVMMELGPLLTAIMVAGRSGSAIAAEIGAMKVSEEIDALRSMGIDPVPYLVIPKLFAILLTMPLLTAFANFSGIFGGAVIGYTYLQIDFHVFYNEVTLALRYYEMFTGFVKSIVFATIIIVVGSYYGLYVDGGAEEVGRSTTRSVVVSIFLVIVADAVLGLIFYLN